MEHNLLTTIKNSINKKLLCIILILLIIPLILLILFRFTPKNMLISNLNNISNKINQYNSSLANAINDKSIDTSSAKEILSDGIQALDTINDDLYKLETSEDNIVLINSFKNLLKDNILLFEVSLAILNNPSSEKIKSKYQTLTKTLDELLKNCENIQKYGVNYSLSKETLIFFSNLQNYTNGLIKINIQHDIEAEQKREFTIDIDTCFDQLMNLRRDLKPAITHIKKDNRSLDVILDNINSMKSTFLVLKKNSKSFSIPPIGKDCYSSLEDTIKLFSIYLDSIENAVLTDIDNGESSDSTKLYESAYSKYEDFNTSLDKLSEEISILNQ